MTAPLCCVCIPPVNTKNLLTAFCFKHKIFLLVTLSKVLQTPQLSFRELALTATGLIGGGWYGGNPWDPMAACVDRRSLGICLKATNKNAQLSFGKHQKALILDPPGKTGAVEFWKLFWGSFTNLSPGTTWFFFSFPVAASWSSWLLRQMDIMTLATNLPKVGKDCWGKEYAQKYQQSTD